MTTILIAVGIVAVCFIAFVAGILVGNVQGQQEACDKWMLVLREKEEELRKYKYKELSQYEDR